MPAVVTSKPPPGSNQTLVDLVFLNYKPQALLDELNAVQKGHNYSDADILKNYTTILTNEVLGIYAKQEWNRSTPAAGDGGEF
jgi:hypothetical protein